MGLKDAVARNLGKLFRNVKDPQWVAAQAAETATSIYVLSPLGHKAKAYIQAHLFDGDRKVGEVYECQNGHQYVQAMDGSKYALHPHTEAWHTA